MKPSSTWVAVDSWLKKELEFARVSIDDHNLTSDDQYHIEWPEKWSGFCLTSLTGSGGPVYGHGSGLKLSTESKTASVAIHESIL